MTQTGHRAPAGDVVAAWEDVRHPERPPLLILEPLERYLDGLGLGAGPAAVEPFAGGHSNATFLIRRGEWRAVLRRPPRPPFPPGAHDVVREGRLLRALAGTQVPVPSVLDICESPDVIGAPFVVMELISGETVEDRVPAALDTVEERRRLGEAFVDTLIAVHEVDPEAAGLDSLGRRGGYLERQLRRFSAGWEANKTRDLPTMPELERRLRASMPHSHETTVVHGDYRLGNAMFSSEAPARVVALLDWEMGALGDPLADLGYLCATWTDRRDEHRPAFHLSPVTAAPGFPTRDDLVDRYERRSGRSAAHLPWYWALAAWKSAVFMEGNYRRAASGMSDDPWALEFRAGVEELAELGLSALTRL
jgi:aminoglycoside phosphotransferase (APT) family kinase protein